MSPAPIPGRPAACPATLARRVRSCSCASSTASDNNFKPLTGSAAKAVSCPTTTSASRKFRSQNPGLFNVTGLSDHPYAQNQSPVSKAGNRLTTPSSRTSRKSESTIDHLNRTYGSSKKYPIYNDEYGYITNPPNLKRNGHNYVSPGDGGLLHQLGRVPELEEPADRQLHAVPAARPAAHHRALRGLRQRAVTSPTASPRRPTRLPGAAVHAQDQAQRRPVGRGVGRGPAGKFMQTDSHQPSPSRSSSSPTGREPGRPCRPSTPPGTSTSTSSSRAAATCG